jgi:hypothetical protein
MKTLVLFLAMTLGSLNTGTSLSPKTDDPIKKMEVNTSPLTTVMTIIEEINFQMQKTDVDDFLDNVIYNTVNENLSIVTNRPMTFLQLLDEEGNIDFQLPVFSESITIDLKDLQKGNWTLQFVIDNDTTVPATFTKI